MGQLQKAVHHTCEAVQGKRYKGTVQKVSTQVCSDWRTEICAQRQGMPGPTSFRTLLLCYALDLPVVYPMQLKAYMGQRSEIPSTTPQVSPLLYRIPQQVTADYDEPGCIQPKLHASLAEAV
jgi:hypothetical protein